QPRLRLRLGRSDRADVRYNDSSRNFFMSVGTEPDLSRLRIDRDAAPRRRWMPWVVLLAIAAAAAAAYPSARTFVAERRAPEVDVATVTQVAAAGCGELPRAAACLGA